MDLNKEIVKEDVNEKQILWDAQQIEQEGRTFLYPCLKVHYSLGLSLFVFFYIVFLYFLAKLSLRRIYFWVLSTGGEV